MTPAQLAHFREKLDRMGATLLRELEAMPTLGPNDDLRIGDRTDQATAEADREFDVANRERARQLLAEVNQALVRIDNGTYGICEDTGEPIGLKRLEAQPTATLSIEAQERRERGGR